MKNMIRQRIAAIAFGLGVLASATTLFGQRPESTCGLSSLSGTYAFAAHGFNIVSGVALPKAIVETIQFNGDGTLVAPFATLSINGTIIHNSGATGTYTVNADCTGTITFVPGPSFDFVIGRAGNQLWMIQTVDPAGAGPVFDGTAARVSR